MSFIPNHTFGTALLVIFAMTGAAFAGDGDAPPTAHTNQDAMPVGHTNQDGMTPPGGDLPSLLPDRPGLVSPVRPSIDDGTAAGGINAPPRPSIFAPRGSGNLDAPPFVPLLPTDFLFFVFPNFGYMNASGTVATPPPPPGPPVPALGIGPRSMFRHGPLP